MTSKLKVLIIGGVAGGATAAARLRRLSEEHEIIMFERDEYISFANCGLPYYIGGEITEKSALTVQTPEAFRQRYNVDVRVRHEVTKIDRGTKTISVQNHLTGETYTETYDKLILSPGAEPIRPQGNGFDSEKVFTLRNIPDTYRIKDFIDTNHPKSAVIIGGGYIGLEMAENLHRIGVNVSIIQRGDHVLGPLDFDMACDVHRHIESKGVRLYLKNEVQRLEEINGQLSIATNDTNIVTDMVILAIGVKPETSLAKDVGLEVSERGAIIVSKTMQTSDPDIYALGDAVEVVDFLADEKKCYIPLAGPANKQGRIVADNICGRKSQYHGTQGSSILRVFDMTVATTGMNETTAKKFEKHYEKVFLWSPSHAGYYPGATNMSIKLLFDTESQKVLGAQITGYEGVDKRCDVIATAIRGKMDIHELAELELCYAPPYSSAKDPVNMAGFVAGNICNGLVKMFHWHDVASLQNRDDAMLLDVRTKMEYENGHIDGFINIPVDELRNRLSELDRSKKIYVTCQTGVRAYAATRILVQSGFDAYNLSGGYRLWRSIFGPKELPTKTHDKRAINIMSENKTKIIDACGLQCPGPIMKLSAAMKDAKDGDTIEIKTTDPAFASDLEGFVRRTNSTLLEASSDKGVTVSKIQKGKTLESDGVTPHAPREHGKNFIVFSGDLDKAIAAFIMANAAAALGRKVSIFFTFWGLNILRKPESVPVRKDFISKMFGWMMPRGSKRLPLSKMNMGGLGAKMIRSVMKQKNIASLEDLIKSAQEQGVELVACSMSMDVMGIKPEELIDDVKLGGAAAMLVHAEESDMSLFI